MYVYTYHASYFLFKNILVKNCCLYTAYFTANHDIERIIPVLATFCALFGRLISTLHDGEFCQEDVLPGAISKIMPFQLIEIVSMSSFLKDISLGLVELAFPEIRSSINEHYRFVLKFNSGPTSTSNDNNRNSQMTELMWPHLLKVCVSLLRQLHTRDLRRGFCPENHWTVHTLNLPLDKPTDLEIPRSRRGLRPFQPIKDFTREDFGMFFFSNFLLHETNTKNVLT